MNQNQFKEFILKLSHDLAGQRRCFDLVNALLQENYPNLEDAKILLTETILQFDLTQKSIANIQAKFLEEKKLEI